MELLVAMFTLGLVTSLHCVSMCGPMVVSYALKGAKDDTWAARLTPNLAYQAAKIASYMLVGFVLGAIGAAFNLDAVRPYVMVGAGLFMIVLALGMTGKFPWAARLTPKPPKFLVTALSRSRRKARDNAEEGVSSLGTPITFGLLTGLFPCAPLVAAQLNAAAAGSPVSGAFAMLAFGLGTAPLMLAFGTASSLIPSRLKQRVMVLLAVVVLGFGLVYLNRGAMLLGSPVTAQSVKQAVVGGPVQSATDEEFTVGEDGVVEVPLTIANVQFQPTVVSIPADRPVRLVVDRQEDNACSDQLSVSQLGVLVDLEPFATTIVDLPATTAGSYTLTCGMGMMSGQLSVGGASALASGPRTAVLLLAAAGVLGAVRFASRRRTLEPAGIEDRRTHAGKDPAPAMYFGLTPAQLIVVAGVIGLAAMTGLVLGGAIA